MAHLLLPRSGFDLRLEANLDAPGKAYVAVCVVWSGLLFAGIGCLIQLRHLTFIRMRNVALAASAVLMLHVYLVLVLIRYPINGLYPCRFEFWIMSTYFPIGIALFQAQNMQLLDLSCLQHQLMIEPLRRPAKSLKRRGVLAGLRDAWRRMSLVGRTYVCIAMGIVLQITLSLVIYLASPKFRSTSNTSDPASAAQCRRGWEWLPSALWQAVWTFGFGPYILFKIRKIHDIHRWKLQTALAIVCSLPGLPLVISALYAPAFDSVTKYWPPPMWFAPGIMMMEFVTIFFPLLEAYEARFRRKVTLAALEEWEQSRKEGGSLSSDSVKPSLESNRSQKHERRDLYTMQALEKVLETDATELLHFAATKEFTGENIVFLTQVRDWRRSWDRAASGKGGMNLTSKRRLYSTAAEIFFTSVSLQTAQFPVNIESKIYFALEQLFRSSACSPAQKSTATPFADDGATTVSAGTPQASTLPPSSEHSVTDEEAGRPELFSGVDDTAIPLEFDGSVFDRAQASVKYMVFTNTWARYVDACEAASLRSSIQSSSTSRSSPSLLSSLRKR